MNGVVDNIGYEKKRLRISIFDMFVIVYILHKLMPFVGYHTPGLVFLGVFALLWLASFEKIGRARKINTFYRMLLLLSLSVLVFVRSFMTGGLSSFAMHMYGELQILLFGVIVLAYEDKVNKYKKKYLFSLIVFCYIITAITTVVGNMRYPTASRILATGDAAGVALYTSQNIGGFTFVYELVLITPLIIYMFKDKKMNRLLALSFVILIGFTIQKTEYATALLFFVLSLFLFFIPKLTNKKIYFILSVFVIMFVINSDYFADLIAQLGQSINSDVVATRFEELADIIRGDSVVDVGNIGNVGNRAERYRNSFNTFVNTGFIGSWGSEVVGDIGGHSFILDNMARYGIFGIFAMLTMYVTVYSLFIKPYRSQKFYSYMFYTFLVSIVLAFVNTKTNLFIFIVVFPLFASVMEEKNFKGSEDIE